MPTITTTQVATQIRKEAIRYLAKKNGVDRDVVLGLLAVEHRGTVDGFEALVAAGIEGALRLAGTGHLVLVTA